MPVTEKQGYANGTEYSQERKDSGAYPNLFYIHLITSTLVLAIQERRSGCPLVPVAVDIIRPATLAGEGCRIRCRWFCIFRCNEPRRDDRLSCPRANHPVYEVRSSVRDIVTFSMEAGHRM